MRIRQLANRFAQLLPDPVFAFGGNPVNLIGQNSALLFKFVAPSHAFGSLDAILVADSYQQFAVFQQSRKRASQACAACGQIGDH